MQIEHNEQNGITFVKFTGKILGAQDSITVNQLMTELVDQGKTKIIIDLSEVDVMNSSGLGIIIQSANLIEAKGAKLKLANVSKKVENLLVITKLNFVFDIHASVKSAVDSF